MIRLSSLACVPIFAALLFADDEPNIFISDVSGKAFLLTLDGAKIDLTRKEHYGRKLHVGEKLMCQPGCTLVIQSETDSQKILPNSKWVTIPWRPPATQTAQQKRNKEAADRYGRPGASEKAVRSTVYSPAGASIVRPSTFRMAWTKSEVPGIASLSIADEDGNELWRQNGIYGGAGFLESPAARDALRKYRDSGARGSLTLVLDPAAGHKAEVFFTLLPQATERELEQQLNDWDLPATDLMRYLGRASVFAQHRMANEEALEFEAALDQAPASVDLLVRTVVAERRVGNLDRARELERRLPQGTPIPE